MRSDLLASQLVIGNGFNEASRLRIEDTLSHLLPCITGDYCISGGIATAAQLTRAGLQTGDRPLNDIDIVAQSLDFLGMAKQGFEIPKLSPHDPIDGFYAGLTDITTGVHVDIFGFSRFPPQIEQAVLGDRLVPIRTAANLGALFLCAIERRIREDLPKIPKQFTDLNALMAITDMRDIEWSWNNFPSGLTRTAGEAWDTVRTFIAANPAIIR